VVDLLITTGPVAPASAPIAARPFSRTGSADLSKSSQDSAEFGNIPYNVRGAARGRNQSELPLEHYWFASRWSLTSCQEASFDAFAEQS
jgi:hypothetical protein